MESALISHLAYLMPLLVHLYLILSKWTWMNFLQLNHDGLMKFRVYVPYLVSPRRALLRRVYVTGFGGS